MMANQFQFRHLLTSAVVLLSVLVTGCGGGDGAGTSQVGGTGTLNVSLTDAPACGYEQVNVTVSRVRVHQNDSANENTAGWTDIVLPSPQKINLLNLNDPTQPNFALYSLGETSLGAGHYTQVRLVLVPNSGNPNPPFNNSIVLQGQSQEIKLDTPSGVQSGIKLVNEFDVPSGQRVDLLLDFDACHSIVQRGNGTYALKPVIKVIPYVLNGIEGFVDTALLGNNVVVSAQVNGDIVRATVPNASTDPNLRGKFFLARLTPGINYDVVITARNSPTNTCCATAVITGVPVPASTSITPISTRQQPFQLPSSVFHVLGDTVALVNPPAVDDRDDATVVVAAKQTLAGGPTVTVRTQVATVNDTAAPIGDYTYGLVVPTGVPSKAPYGALPIVPSTIGQAGVAGVYAVYGSARTPTASYTAQNPAPASVDISSGDRLDQDFTLAP
jgi:predicted small secreted protein